MKFSEIPVHRPWLAIALFAISAVFLFTETYLSVEIETLKVLAQKLITNLPKK